jgi:NodT family efflux transporter outer membrane factor (OMF) lipoprotein
VAALAASALLAGCAGVDVPALPADAPAAWRHADASVPGAPVPDPAGWWKTFQDPALDALVERALAQNLTLAQAATRMRQARRQAAHDGAQYLPMVGASTRATQDPSATDAYYQASVDATWELGLFGAREGLARTLQARALSADAAAQAARLTVAAETARQYLLLRTARRQQALLARSAALDARAAELAEVRARQRLAPQDDARQARAREALTLALQAAPRQEADQAAQALAVLLGQSAPDDAWTASDAPPPALGDFALPQLPADLVRSRPDIRQAEAEVLKSAGELGLARAELYPRLTLGASYIYSYNLTQNRGRRFTDNLPVVGPFVDIPLFDWGRRRAQADARQDALDAALLGYRQALLEGIAESENALSGLQAQREREARLQSALSLQQDRLRAQRTLERLGLSATLDGIAVQRAGLQAESELLGARAARAMAFVALYKALGAAPLPAGDAPSAAVAAAASPAREAAP